MAFLPEKRSSACARTQTQTHTALPIISGCPQTLESYPQSLRENASHWHSEKSSAPRHLPKEKSFSSFHVHENTSGISGKIDASQPTKPHACCLRSLSFCSFQPEMAFSSREQELVIEIADDNGLSSSLAVGMLVERAGVLPSPRSVSLSSRVNILNTQGAFNPAMSWFWRSAFLRHCSVLVLGSHQLAGMLETNLSFW